MSSVEQVVQAFLPEIKDLLKKLGPTQRDPVVDYLFPETVEPSLKCRKLDSSEECSYNNTEVVRQVSREPERKIKLDQEESTNSFVVSILAPGVNISDIPSSVLKEAVEFILCTSNDADEVKIKENLVNSVIVERIGDIDASSLNDIFETMESAREILFVKFLYYGSEVSSLAGFFDKEILVRVMFEFLSSSKVRKENVSSLYSLLSSNSWLMDQASIVDALASFLEPSLPELHSCMKFSKLIMHILNSVTRLDNSAKERFGKIVTSNKTFLKKSLSSKIDSITT